MSETPSRDPSRDNAMSVAAISSERIESDDNAWTRRLVFFLRIMAVAAVIEGLYHWAQFAGFIGGEEDAFENQPMAWQTATVYFAVIELVAAVGLWLGTAAGEVGGEEAGGWGGGNSSEGFRKNMEATCCWMVGKRKGWRIVPRTRGWPLRNSRHRPLAKL